jgi:cupin 2 domain-containing protein
MVASGNIFVGVGPASAGEVTTTLASRPGALVERIVSTGQASPPGFWYDQDWTEWVIVLAGEASVQIEGEAASRTLGPGDWLELPAHVRHRVEWTRADPATVWLAVHWKDGAHDSPLCRGGQTSAAPPAESIRGRFSGGDVGRGR